MTQAARKDRSPDTLSGALRAMDVDALADVLATRPEAAPAASAHRPDLSAVADALSRPPGIRRAMSSLDEFQVKLLMVAAWYGPRVPLSLLRDQAKGVRIDDLAEGCRGLARHALAFPTGGRNDWSLWVPPCVVQVVESYGIPGPHLRDALGWRTVDELLKIAHRLGISWPERPRKEVVRDGLVDALSDPLAVDVALADAPEAAREALAYVRDGRGRVSWDDLIAEGMADYGDLGPVASRPRRGQQSGVGWLEQRALLVRSLEYGGGPNGSGFFVAGEVEVALRGGAMFPEWLPRPPVPRTAPARTGAPERGPEQVVADAEALLHYWESSPPPRLKAGGLGARELRKTAQRTGIDERLVGFLYALLVEAGLVCHDGDTVTAASSASEWVRKPPPEKWATLFQAWRRALLWSETDDSLVALSSSPFVDHSELRTAVLEALAQVPPGQTADAASLGRCASWFGPNQFHCCDCAAQFVERIAGALAWLGSARAGPAIALLEPARTALSDPQWASSPNGAAAAFPSPVSECTVQADLTVIVPGVPVPELGYGLARFAELRASSPARVYRISDDSVRRALDLGMTAEEMMSLLESHAPRGIPQAVAYLIEDLARRHGRVTVGEGGVYVRADEPGLLASAIADKRMKKLGPRVLAPTVAVVREVTVASLLKTLRQAGYMPVAEDGGATIAGSVDRRRPILRRADSQTGTGLPADGARRAAELLIGGGAPEAAAPRAPRIEVERAGILRLLRQVRQHDGVVVLGYRNGKGSPVHIVEPVVVTRRQLSGWALDVGEPKTFEVARIEWVREVDEAELRDSYEPG